MTSDLSTLNQKMIQPFIEQPETLVDVQMIELVVVIDQGLVHLLPAPQDQQDLVFDHDVQLVV